MSWLQGNYLDFQPTIDNAIRVNAEKGNAPGFPGQFRWNPATYTTSKTQENVSINQQVGPGIPNIGVKPPWQFDGMIPDVAFTSVTDTAQTTNIKFVATILLILGIIMAFGPST